MNCQELTRFVVSMEYIHTHILLTHTLYKCSVHSQRAVAVDAKSLLTFKATSSVGIELAMPRLDIWDTFIIVLLWRSYSFSICYEFLWFFHLTYMHLVSQPASYVLNISLIVRWRPMCNIITREKERANEGESVRVGENKRERERDFLSSWLTSVLIKLMSFAWNVFVGTTTMLVSYETGSTKA